MVSQEFTGAPKRDEEKVPFTLNDLKHNKLKITLFFINDLTIKMGSCSEGNLYI